jgi:hypothetical protein
MTAARFGRRFNLRAVPWLVALVGLAIPMVGGGFVGWLFVAAWLAILAMIWFVGGALLPIGRGPRIALAAAALPALFLLGWEGGWWLIPADLAWLVIEVAAPAG